MTFNRGLERTEDSKDDSPDNEGITPKETYTELGKEIDGKSQRKTKLEPLTLLIHGTPPTERIMEWSQKGS